MNITAFDIVLVLAGICSLLYLLPLKLLQMARNEGISVNLTDIFGMYLRRVNPESILYPLVNAAQAGLELDRNELECHYLAKGNVNVVTDALIQAKNAGITLDFSTAAAIDLSGRDLSAELQKAIHPRILETPVLAARSGDGKDIRFFCRVSVKTNLAQLIGGAGEDTIRARVGEAVIICIRRHEAGDFKAYSGTYAAELLKQDLDRCAALTVTGIEIEIVNNK